MKNFPALFFTEQPSPSLFSFATTCSEFEFACKSDGICIPLLWKCDLTPDCSDGSDENANECDQSSVVQNQCDNKSFFHCKSSRKCIPKQWLCDEVFDCGLFGKFNFLDSSDEQQNCTIKCPVNKLPCINGLCLHISNFCDGHVHCPNDEFSCGGQSLCKNLKCDYECKITPHGPQCFCPPGQDIINSTKCIVQQKCTENILDNGTMQSCDQHCVNYQGNNICSCAPGYELFNNKCYGVNSECFFYFLIISSMK